MPYVSTFMYAKDTQRDNNNELIVRSPLQIFAPKFIPSEFSFSIVLGILDLDLEKQHKFRLTFVSPDNEVILDTGEQDTPLTKMDKMPQHLRGIMLSMDFRNIPLKSTGMYKTEVFINKKKLDSFPIYVTKAQGKGE